MNLNKAIDCLKNGRVIIYPTESCYAFGADAKNYSAIAKIKKLKNQPIDKPIHAIVDNLDQIKNIGIPNLVAEKLSKKFHPGQLNLIIDFIKPKKYQYLSNSGIAFRIPKNKIARELCQKFGSLITTTSANIHGEPAIYKIDDIRSKFDHRVCQIIDAGNLNKSTPVSTIFDTRTRKIIREGPITLEEIDEILK